ncbi:MAG: hypothetical protein DMF53_25475 [Acidobacteria bacterium]|nr:MAG: hypothetical protein DMF53_25475 [Acidobacteriota bacterium]
MKLDVLAIGAHPDDVELGCGGTLAVLASQRRRVGILHLTRGEMGTRGTAEERIAEAESAARVLGAVEMDFLDCGDGGLRTGPAEEDALIARLRLWQPDLVLGPTPSVPRRRGRRSGRPPSSPTCSTTISPPASWWTSPPAGRPRSRRCAPTAASSTAAGPRPGNR